MVRLYVACHYGFNSHFGTGAAHPFFKSCPLRDRSDVRLRTGVRINYNLWHTAQMWFYLRRTNISVYKSDTINVWVFPQTAVETQGLMRTALILSHIINTS